MGSATVASKWPMEKKQRRKPNKTKTDLAVCSIPSHFSKIQTTSKRAVAARGLANSIPLLRLRDVVSYHLLQKMYS